MSSMRLDIGEDLVELIAQRAAELIQQNGGSKAEDGWLRGADKIAAYIDSPRSRVYASSLRDASRSTTTARRSSPAALT